MPETKRMLIERLFALHQATLQAFFYRRVKEKYHVADLVQEVYLRMLRVKDTDAIRNPEGYLFTVASNLVFEQAVLNGRQSTSVDFDHATEHAADTTAVGFEDLFDTAARVSRLRKVLTQLPPKCQAVVHMKYDHGLTYEEIAGQLEISTHMVQKYLASALAHCRLRMARLK